MISNNIGISTGFSVSGENAVIYQQLIEGIPEPAYLCDAAGYIIIYNQSAAGLWGRHPVINKEQWCGSLRLYSLAGDIIPLDECPMAIALKEGRIVEEEVIIERMDGTRINVIPYPKPIFDASGSIIGAINIFKDITDSKTAEARSFRLSAIIRSSHDAIISKTLEGIVTSWNPSAERLFGYTAAEMIGQPILKIIPDDRLDEEPQILRRIRNGEVVDHFETIRKTKSGSLIDISLTISPILDSHHKIVGVSKIARDITSQKLLVNSLLESEERFKVIANSVPVMIWMTGVDQQLQFANKNFIDFIGIEEKDLFTDWQQYLHPDDIVRVTGLYVSAFDKKTTFEIECRLQKKDGEHKWIRCTGVPRFTKDGVFEGYIAGGMDISIIKEHEQRKDDFIKMASHELKTPVTSIKGFVQVLLTNTGKEKDPFFHSSLSIVDKQVSKLTKLINDLLDLTRIDSGMMYLKKEHFDIIQLTREIIAEIKHISSAHTIELQAPARCIVFADSDKISQVLINYLMNAIKYSSPSAKVTVTIEQNDDEIILSVTDHGIGISKEDLPKIFERFYRALGKEEITYPGFGIGLFIVREIIKNHGGRTWAESEKNKGSKFYFSVPVALNNQ